MQICWQGVNLDDEGHVSELCLPHNGLRGRLGDTDLADLRWLLKLDVSDNDLRAGLDNFVADDGDAGGSGSDSDGDDGGGGGDGSNGKPPPNALALALAASAKLPPPAFLIDNMTSLVELRLHDNPRLGAAEASSISDVQLARLVNLEVSRSPAQRFHAAPRACRERGWGSQTRILQNVSSSCSHVCAALSY